MRKILELAILGFVVACCASQFAFPEKTSAESSLNISYPPTNHQTTAERIFMIGSAPPGAEVLVNGKAIQRSSAGHFAPSFPLQLGDNLFTIRYKNQEVRLKVTRTTSQPKAPKGLMFAEDSLHPKMDIARLPGELICFEAVAPADANVSVQLGNQTIPLMSQEKVVELPPNAAALTQQNQPDAFVVAGYYMGCSAASAVANLGYPQFQLEKNGQTVTQTGTGKVEILSPTQLEIAEVIEDAGVARTGPSTDYSRLTPLPKGTRASITGREGEWVRLDYGGWINSKEVKIVKGSVPPRSLIRSIRARQVPGATEVVFPLQVPVPMTVQQGDQTLILNLYNTTAQTDIIRFNPDPVVSRMDWQQVAPSHVQYVLRLKPEQQWGYKLRYEGTSLVLSVLHPPSRAKNANQPLSGIKILLDPGHGGTDTGAIGPTGYPEKEVTLIMSKLLANQLIARGATVYLTRQEDKTLSLPERVAMIDQVQPAIALSIHYNSLPDEGDALNTQGFGTFWYHPQAHSLAAFLHNHMVNRAGRPSYGVFWDNLALARPAGAPSVLLEIGFMSNPMEFEWVVNPQEQQKVAADLAEGITQWFATVR